MNYKDLDIKISYHSQGPDNIVEAFINPALKCTKIYKRSVGFFSSSVLSSVLDGIQALVDNDGSIQLIASPRLSQEDIDAINLGLQEKDQIVNNCFSKSFEEELQKISDEELILLAKLVALKKLEIQIAVTDAKYGDGMYHDKFGILEDFDGNKVVFYGSPNSSHHGYNSNFEKIRVVKSWIPGQNISVLDEEQEFESLWLKYSDLVTVYDFQETAKKQLFQVVKRRGLKVDIDHDEKTDGEYGAADPQTGIRLRKYQEKAIQAWKDNNYKGFFVMATGTGKTYTAFQIVYRLLRAGLKKKILYLFRCDINSEENCKKLLLLMWKKILGLFFGDFCEEMLVKIKISWKEFNQ